MSQTLEGHADHRFDGELNVLHIKILEMGALALDQSKLALHAVKQLDPTTIDRIFQQETRVNAFQIKIDALILELIAKRAPVAKDLRITMAFSRVVVDFERISDEVAKIAHLLTILMDDEHSKPGKKLTRDILAMGTLSSNFLATALHGFDTLNANSVKPVIIGEPELDATFQSTLRVLTTYVLEDARNLGHSINITLILKSLERIGAHAVNIAEYVTYLVNGEEPQR